MKVKSIQVGGAYTWFPEPYHAIRGEACITIDGGSSKEIEEVQEEVTRLIVGQIQFIYEDVHEEIDTSINFEWLKENVGKGVVEAIETTETESVDFFDDED